MMTRCGYCGKFLNYSGHNTPTSPDFVDQESMDTVQMTVKSFTFFYIVKLKANNGQEGHVWNNLHEFNTFNSLYPGLPGTRKVKAIWIYWYKGQ